MTIDTDRVRGKWIYHSCKRAFDFCVSALALIILSPLFLIIAVAIKLDDHDVVGKLS
ncbi:Bacterial sugar transferase [Lactiplantibacillus plantarum]|uniref:sugar transferase n=1 Tax=Lactiplantibacillus plantarum TaxID=1590 RepID=UPI000CF9B3BF|nr:sugar transferase [Lactiplantibacillus plantarum]SPE13762.1 Bacterial sugar transferase [Lactiplantibacillus plantarum]SPH08623.1 Bacterial sugar transferase [Lactiplantibacillus plantarum]